MPNMKFSGHTLFNNAAIEIALRDDRVESIREGTTTDSKIWIAPAPIDIQVNGFAGFDLNTETVTLDDVRAMVRALWRVGTGFLYPTVVTGSFDRICNSMRAIVDACKTDPLVNYAVLGIHLEAPTSPPKTDHEARIPWHTSGIQIGTNSSGGKTLPKGKSAS